MSATEPTPSFICPACGLYSLSLLEYTSLMVLRPDLGLFTVECPNCGSKISSIQVIPACLHEEISLAAKEVGAGMGASGTSGANTSSDFPSTNPKAPSD